MDELQQAQNNLGRAIDRARAGEDPALAGIVREKGEQAVHLLHGLIRMSRVHAPTNSALNQPVAELCASLARLAELLGTVNLVAVEDQVYINEIRIRTSQQVKDGHHLGAELAPHNVGGLLFHSAPTEAQLRALLACVNAKPAAKRPRAALRDALRAAGAATIEPALLHRFRMAGEVAQPQERRSPQAVLVRTTAAVEELWDGVAAGRRPNILPLRRAVTDLLDAGPAHEELFREPPGARAFAVHALRVAQLSLMVGEVLGLPPGAMQDLGLAGLVHDLGHAAAAGGPQPPPERHPALGALALLRQVGFHEGKVWRVLATAEHHRPFDAAGPRPSLFARIVRTAEDYDNLVRPGGRGLEPPRAVAQLVAGAGTRYDPAPARILATRLGRYPPGSVLRLADGHVVRSRSVARSPALFDKPRVEVIRNPDGSVPTEPVVRDMASPGAPPVAEVLRG